MKELLILMVILLAFSLGSIIVLSPDYRYYKRVYKTLKDKTFYLNMDHVYSYSRHHSYEEQEHGFIWFLNDGSFKLCGNSYLHNTVYTYINPYALYWLLKYKRWAKKNIDINKLEKF